MATSFDEIGDSGLGWMTSVTGAVEKAYLPELTWPSVSPIYSRIYRSDPEVSIVRAILDTFTSKVSMRYTMPEIDQDTYDPDMLETLEEAIEFGNEVLDDIEGSTNQLLSSCISHAVLLGFVWYEIVPGYRLKTWQPPGEDPWRSSYNDGKLGIRRISLRPHESFYSWQFDKEGRYVTGFVQTTNSGGTITIPKSRSLHIIYGDQYNPEGLASLEAIYRLERIKKNLEIIQGIGFEHSAGHLSVSSTKQKLSADDTEMIRRGARAILTAQEGNYAIWPPGVTAQVVDIGFQSAQAILDAIRYYGLLKLAVIQMQWAGLGTLSPYGSYSTIKEAVEFFVTWLNSVVQGVVMQINDQLTPMIFNNSINQGDYSNLEKLPVLSADNIEKEFNLSELAQFLTAVNSIMPLGDDDYLAIRHRSGFLPEVLPEIEAEPIVEEPEPTEGEPGEIETTDEPPVAQPEDETPASDMQMPSRPFMVGEDEEYETTEYLADDVGDPDGIRKAIEAFKRWAKENEPELANLLDAKIE